MKFEEKDGWETTNEIKKNLSSNPNSLRTNIWRCVEMENNGWRVGEKQMIKK